MAHTRPPSTYHWHLRFCPTTEPRLVSWCIRNQCDVSVVRRWQLASCWHLTKCSPATCFLRGPKQWKSLGHETGTDEKMAHNLPDIVLQPVTSPVGRRAPSDFKLFRPLKKHHFGKQIATQVDVKQSATSWPQTPDTNFFYVRIQALVPKWDRCLNVSDEHKVVWYVPYDNHVSCIQWSQNKVFSTKVSITFCFETSMCMYFRKTIVLLYISEYLLEGLSKKSTVKKSLFKNELQQHNKYSI